MDRAPVLCLEVVDSTMDEVAAMQAAGDVTPWTAVVADFQRHGRGRAGRAWQAPPGSALLTTIYAPISLDLGRVGMLSIAAGLGVAEALASYGVAARLKWPNDVLVEDRKLAGILISTRLDERIEASVGIGLNLSAAPPGAISLGDLGLQPPAPLTILEPIREALARCWCELEEGRFACVSERWNRRAAWLGETVSLADDGQRTGRFVAIDEWGRLRLGTPAGELTLDQSEIVRGPTLQRAAPYT